MGRSRAVHGSRLTHTVPLSIGGSQLRSPCRSRHHGSPDRSRPDRSVRVATFGRCAQRTPRWRGTRIACCRRVGMVLDEMPAEHARGLLHRPIRVSYRSRCRCSAAACAATGNHKDHRSDDFGCAQGPTGAPQSQSRGRRRASARNTAICRQRRSTSALPPGEPTEAAAAAPRWSSRGARRSRPTALDRRASRTGQAAPAQARARPSRGT